MSAPTEASPEDGWLEDVVLQQRLELAAAALEGPMELGVFTDEEVAALEDASGVPSAPSPWLMSLSEDERTIALTAALRGLSARGLLRAGSEDAVLARVEPQIVAVLSMRRYADVVVVAERRPGDGVPDWVVLYRQQAGLWLSERVDRGGLHAFVLAEAPVQAEAMTEWCGVRADRPAPAFDRRFTRAELAGPPPELEPVGRSAYAITVTRFDVDREAGETREAWSGVFTGPEGAYLSTADGGDVRYAGADREAVGSHWRGTLDAG